MPIGSFFGKLSYMKIFLSILISLAMLVGCTPTPDVGMDIYTFSIGKADCSLLSFDGFNVLIDAGEEDDGGDIFRELHTLQVSKLDLVILTHFDRDHIGGYGELSDFIPIEKVILPDYARESEFYEIMESSILEHDTPVERLSADASFTLGRASFTVWASTQTYDPEKGNDNAMSLVTAVTYGQTRLVFLADAEGGWFKDLCYKGYELGCDIVKMPCHGKWNKNIPAMLALPLPQFAIVTDSEKNPAAEKTLDALTALDITTLRTIDGNVHLFTDGQKVTAR